MSSKVTFNVETKPELLEDIATQVEDLAEREDWPAKLTFKVNLVLEEVGLNIMNHGHEGGVHEIEITMISEDDALTLEITDDGKPFDPLKDAPLPDVNAAMEERPIGGLGIHLVRTMMDELCYRRERGKNHLTLVARRD
jgi:serine/threonine-protein kinase RsbW